MKTERAGAGWCGGFRSGEKGAGGYSLPELLIACVLTGLFAGLVLALLLAAERALLPRRVAGGAGEVLPVAPCFEQAPRALALHGVLRERLACCSAAYVFGGERGGAPAEWNGAHPLDLEGLPALGMLREGLPMECGTLVDLYGGEWPQTGVGDPTDFTVLVIGRRQDGTHGATCLVQTRTTLLSEGVRVGGQSLLRREVRLWAENGESQAYAFAEPMGAGGFSGAIHAWHRRPRFGRPGEEAPALVVFPDPWVFGGARSPAGEDPRGSRYSYFIPVYP